MKVGSKIMNPDGTIQSVIQVHPQGEKQLYRVTFCDGSTTEVCADHLWKCTISNSSGKRRGEKVTKWMLRDTKGLISILNKDNNQYPLVPLSEPISYTKSYRKDPIRIDPYLLGVLIGDGGLTGNHTTVVTTADPEIITKIMKLGYEVSEIQSSEYGYLIVGKKGSQLRDDLRWMGLYGKCSHEKFIPEYYKYSPIEQRKELVCGLMDTDGFVDSRGHCSYTSVSKKLAEDFQEVIWSLGGKATLSEKETTGRLAYTVYFNTAMNPELINLRRKQIRTTYDFNGGNSDLKRRIVKIEPSRIAEAQCITVNNPNSLYITDDFIVTHNSFGMRAYFISACWAYPLEAIILRRTRKDLQENHINAFKAEMKPYIDSGYVKYNERDSSAKFSNGSILYFGYCDKAEDLESIQGKAYDLMGIEESTQFEGAYIDIMISSNRSSNIANRHNTMFDQKCLMTFNWGGRSHEYHRRLFWDKEYEETEDPNDYHFIFAPMESNLVLMKHSPEYKKQLMKLPKQLRDAWIKGDPDAFTGSMFRIVDLFHVVDPEEILKFHGGKIPENWLLFGSLDAATGDYCSFGLYTKTPGGRIYKIFTYYVKDQKPQDHVDSILDRLMDCHWTDGRIPEFIFADRHAYQKHEQHTMRSHDVTWHDIFADKGLHLKKANDKRIPGATAMQHVLDYKYDAEKQKVIRKPKLQFFKGTNNSTIKELMALQRDKNHVDDIDQNAPDHAYDETRYAIMGAFTPDDYEEEVVEELDKKSDYGANRDIDEIVGAAFNQKDETSWEDLF